MAANGKATKRRRKRKQRKNKNNDGREQRKDRLSSLPDDVLITILSLLPLQLAVTTETLSRRWRGLWTNVTSIDITYRELDINNPNYLANFFEDIDKIRMQITSPFIHSFKLGFLHEVDDSCWLPFLESWIHHICDRNVRELKLTRNYCLVDAKVIRLPSVIFQTQSLVSIELVSFLIWKLRDDADPIELPNLKNLKLSLSSANREWALKQIKACPSLENLSIECGIISRWHCWDSSVDKYIKFSNQNLRSLIIFFGDLIYCKTVINAPKLEYLAVRAPKAATFCFDEQPSMLREAKIEASSGRDHKVLSYKGQKTMSKFYGAISNVGSLALDVYVLDNVSSMFFNATRLTIDMKFYRTIDIKTVLLLLELFPVLDILTLKFNALDEKDRHRVLSMPSYIISIILQRVRVRIEIEIIDRYYYLGKEVPFELVDAFSELIEYLLSNAVNLEHFKVILSIDTAEVEKEELELKQRNELRFINQLYQSSMIPIGCELEFQGILFKTSRKSWSQNGNVLPLTYAEKCTDSKLMEGSRIL